MMELAQYKHLTMEEALDTLHNHYVKMAGIPNSSQHWAANRTYCFGGQLAPMASPTLLAAYANIAATLASRL